MDLLAYEAGVSAFTATHTLSGINRARRIGGSLQDIDRWSSTTSRRSVTIDVVGRSSSGMSGMITAGDRR